MSNRLNRYRDFNERLCLTNPSQALKQGSYVRPPGVTAADEIVSYLEPAPLSAVALLGGIGSGKSTELLVAAERLGKTEDTLALYIDVNELHDLGNLEPGVLVAAVGLRVCQLVEQHHHIVHLPGGGIYVTGPQASKGRVLGDLSQQFRAWAETREGWIVDPDWEEASRPQDDDQAPMIQAVVPGKLSMPHRLSGEIKTALQRLRTLRAALPAPSRYVIAVLDSLDRVSDLTRFAETIETDLRVLRSAEIGVVLTAPLLSLYGRHRPLLERFDHIVHLPPVELDSLGKNEGGQFLLNVLESRDPGHVVPNATATHLAVLSGGVLRDMLGLAGDAAKLAYMAGSDKVTEAHATAAAVQLARTRWMGLNANDIAMLRRVMKGETFAPSSDAEFALLMTRRVLEYPQVGMAPRFSVHPVFLPLLSAAQTSNEQ